jgi:UDP-N-acetylglucosamine--N-acetylmuramyl-(pentapeptide) pyrophosphoryl-undecaprenol N-acetylglucosamine transferase
VTARGSAPIVLAAGGTGGHMFPAAALARELVARGAAVALVTDRRGQAFGADLFGKGDLLSKEGAGVVTHRIRAGRFDGGMLGKALGIAELLLGIAQAGRLLRRIAPAAVVGFGGYPSVPTVLAATRRGIPTLIHEQNALLGRANRVLARRVSRIALSFAETARLRERDRRRAVETGNPVRPAVAAIRDVPYLAPGALDPIELVVTGGSQGARIFSDIVPAALALLPEALRARLRITQQARPEDLERVRRQHAESGVAAETAGFFDDIPQRLAKAHLVIARAGASTVAELAVAGRPALLVPYPFAADDHQTANAAAFAGAGGGWAMAQDGFTAPGLAQFLSETLAAPDRLARAAAASRDQGRPEAARRLADLACELAAWTGENGDHRPDFREDAA